MFSIYRLSDKSETPDQSNGVGRREQGKQCAVCLNDSTSSADYVNKQHHEC